MKKLFVSSTFKDMQAERDALRDYVSARINAEARKHGDEIEFCDLRWGIDTSDMEEEEKILEKEYEAMPPEAQREYKYWN